MKKLSGFTLMELMVVISIILLLSIAITATLSISFEKAKKSKAMAEMAEIATACKMFYKDTGAWPRQIRNLFDTEDKWGYDQYGTVSIYFNKPEWKGPYLMTFKAYTEAKDPWNKQYVLPDPLLSDGDTKLLYVRSPGSHLDEPKQLKILVHRFRKP